MVLRLFLSYSRDDQAIVRGLRAGLGEPLEAWVDERELATGERFPERIEAAIKNDCHYTLMILSPRALASEWVARELGWALERESELRQAMPFILPVVLEPLPELPEALRDRQYFSCYDHSEAGIADAAQRLSHGIFSLLARNFARSRASGPRGTLDQLEQGLLKFRDLAFAVQTALTDSIGVLATDRALHAQLNRAVREYATYAEPYVAGLQERAGRVRELWGANLGDEFRSLARWIQEQVYRDVFSLNEQRAQINGYALGPPDAIALAEMDREKAEKLAQVQRSLDELTRRTGDLVAKLRREVG